MGRESYKRDGVRDTLGRKAARKKLVSGLGTEALRGTYGFGVSVGRRWRDRFVEEPGADALDSLLCAVQAAWAYTRRDEGWGVPPECDPNEGWILDPPSSSYRSWEVKGRRGSRSRAAHEKGSAATPESVPRTGPLWPRSPRPPNKHL